MIKKLEEIGLKYSTVESSKAVYFCLDELKALDAIIIENPNELSLNILQTNTENHFYLGFDEELESNGVIFINNSAGANTIGLSSKTVIIFRNLSSANGFLRSWYDNPYIDFFNLEKRGLNRIQYDQEKLSEIVKDGIQSEETMRWWMNRY